MSFIEIPTDDYNIPITFDDIANLEKNKKNKSKYIKDGLPVKYDKRTMEYYRVLRRCKIDPIMGEELDTKRAFEYKYEWDPYTGEHNGLDPYGSLWFDPDHLTHYFYTNRLNNLWVGEQDENTGYYEGYYDCGVGAGKDFYVAGRGYHPEWYLFRVPIVDIYLQKGYSEQIVTMGPVLSKEDLAEIDRLSGLDPKRYEKIYKKNRPSLVEMHELYNESIAKKSDKYTHVAVLKLRQM